MAPTKSLSAAFHSELSEYASLLRAIRTNSTLDLVPQLSTANNHCGSSDCDSDQGDKEDRQLYHQAASHEASDVTQSHNVNKSSKGKNKSPSKSPYRTRREIEEDDNWTRWPLLQEQCPIPDWTFDEEIMALADQCLRSQTSVPQGLEKSNDIATSRIENLEDEDAINDLTLSPTYLAGLTSEAASKLTCILSLLAFHRPSGAFAKHSRLAPMSWLDVLEIVGVAGIFDMAIVKDAKERMEAIFGQSQSQILNRMQILETSRRVLTAAEAPFGVDISIVRPPPIRHGKKRKHGNAKTVSADAQEQIYN